MKRSIFVAFLAVLLVGSGRCQKQDATPPAPTPAPTSKPAIHGPIRIASGVVAKNRISGDEPVYPEKAREAKVSGTVVMSAVIGKDGAIKNLNIISGPPLLRQAALDAVSKWRYRPTKLNGEPVEVATQINVNFTNP
jgi:protein TonB